MTDTSPATRKSPAWRGWAVVLAAMLITFLLGLMAASIVRRREEAQLRLPTQKIDRWETDSSKWEANYPREYEAYKKMADSSARTKHGGAYPRDYLEENPASVVLFAGYGFAKEYRQAQGHLHALEDVTGTKRLSEKTPGTCFTCKSPDALRLIDSLGPEKFYGSKFTDLKPEVKHPIGCLDCHDPDTMQLRVLRPAIREAFKRQGKDIDKATHQEMRSLVCAQCHVEYYFKGKDNYLTLPWDKGTTKGVTAEQMEKYFDEADFSDWTHAMSKTPLVKINHADYELYATGVHAYRDIACADCHMPYRTEGGVKFTDHHVQSPLLNIANSCAVCHRWSEEEMRRRVEGMQDKVQQTRGWAETMLAHAHFDVAAAMQAGATDEELAGVRKLLRHAQLRWDYVASNNGMGFHSPQESTRTLASSIDLAGQCRVECARILAKHGVTKPIDYPDFTSKEKAQAINKAFVDGKPPKLL